MMRVRGATAVLYLWSTLPALLAALPLSLLVGGLWGHQGGDALLWEAGGFSLLETARLLSPTAGALARGLPWGLLAWALAGVAPQALALAMLAPGELTPLERLGRALQSVAPLLLVLGATLLVRVVALLLCLLFAKGLAPGLMGFSDPARMLGQLPLALLALALTSLARVLHDLAAAAVVAREERGKDALLTGLEVLHRRLPAAAGAWALRALLGLVVVGVAVLVGSRWHAGAGLLAAALAHQAGLVGLARLRVSWLRRAIELVA
jgi:hypothetical protein